MGLVDIHMQKKKLDAILIHHVVELTEKEHLNRTAKTIKVL